MTKDQFLAMWSSATPAQRFTAFVDWMTASVPGLPEWVNPAFQLVDGPFGGNCDPGYHLPLAMFQEPTPDNACDLGFAIIIQCGNLAQKNFEKEYKKYKDKMDKKIEKWLEKMWQELFKDMLKAYQEMAKYWWKKYLDEKGS